MIKKAFAKINLALDIIDKDNSGYHQIKTVIQEIPLFDVISFERQEGSHEVNLADFSVCFIGEEAEFIDENDNSILKVIKVIREMGKIRHSYKIVVHKNIPVGAGLGGGSSDAAALINALNTLEGMKLSEEDLYEIAEQISMDAPFFIEGKTALATHFGEKIQLLPPLSQIPDYKKLHKLLIIPKERKNTKEMYAKVDLNKTNKNLQKTTKIIHALKEKNLQLVLQNLHNDFELFTDESFHSTKETLLKNNAEHVLLCGSGTSIITFSSNPFDARVLSQELPNQHILNLNQWEDLSQSG